MDFTIKVYIISVVLNCLQPSYPGFVLIALQNLYQWSSNSTAAILLF